MLKKEDRIKKIELRKENFIDKKNQIEIFLSKVKEAQDNLDSGLRESTNIFIDNIVREAEIIDTELEQMKQDIKFIENHF